MTCPTEDQLLLLLDGGIAPNQAEGLHAHLRGCEVCRGTMKDLEMLAEDLGAPVTGHDLEAHVSSVMRHIASAPEVGGARDGAARAGRPRGRSAWAMSAFGASAVAMAAAVLLFLRAAPDGPTSTGSTFTARGVKESPTLARDVGVSLFAGTTEPVRLAAGAGVTADTTFTAAYTNVHPRSAYLLVFAVDSSATVHWLYPAYTRAREDPSSLALSAASREHLLPTSVILDSPALGELRVVSLATEVALHVSDIEGRPAAGLTHDALVRAFPEGAVHELSLRIEPSRRP